MNTQNIGEGKEIHQPEIIPSPVQETTQTVQECVQNISNSENAGETNHAEAVEYITRYLQKCPYNISFEAELGNIDTIISVIQQSKYLERVKDNIHNHCVNISEVFPIPVTQLDFNTGFEKKDYSSYLKENYQFYRDIEDIDEQTIGSFKKVIINATYVSFLMNKEKDAFSTIENQDKIEAFSDVTGVLVTPFLRRIIQNIEKYSLEEGISHYNGTLRILKDFYDSEVGDIRGYNKVTQEQYCALHSYMICIIYMLQQEMRIAYNTFLIEKYNQHHNSEKPLTE